MLKVKKVEAFKHCAKLPEVAHVGEDIAADLFAAMEISIAPGQIGAVDTGISIEFIPTAGAIIRTRSGMAKKGLQVVGGMVDAGYRGNIIVMLFNSSSTMYHVQIGDKIAQLRRCPVFSELIVEVQELSESTRGTDGFGSTGQ